MSPKKKASSLPKTISPDTSLGPPTYRGSMHLELQKFGDLGGVRQMALSEAIGGEELAQDSVIEVTGLDLSVSEDKALQAIQMLLDKTNYQGNQPGERAAAKVWNLAGNLPRLSITYSDYLEAYGLSKRDGGYHGLQRDEALEALDSLTKPRRIVYQRKRREGKRELYDVIVRKAPLISLWKGYEGLEKEEASQVMAGQDLPQRVTRLVIEAGPLLMDGIEDFYLLKPTTLHQEIQAVLGSRRVSRTVSLFIQWLLTKNLPETAISKDKLAKRLRLDNLIQQRKQSLIQKRLEEAIQTAQELGYLLKWEEDAFGIFHFTLNPDRMGRTPKWRLKAGDKDEEDSSLAE